LPEIKESVYHGGESYGNRESSLQNHAQQSVHPTLGSLRDLQAFFWLRVFSTSQTLSTPAPARVTQTVETVE